MSNDIIYLKVPKKPKYISLIRLTTSSIAHNMGLDIDEIDDIKVSIGEACINALNLKGTEEISIIFEVFDDKLEIVVEGVMEDISDDSEELKMEELGLLIIKSLMDEVVFVDTGIKMIKFIE